MSAVQTVVLNETQINQKIDRLAFQIYENHHDEKELIVGGIAGMGYKLAELLCERLARFSDIKRKTSDGEVFPLLPGGLARAICWADRCVSLGMVLCLCV